VTEDLATLSRRLEGRRVSLALADGSRIDDCALVSAGRGEGRCLWVYNNGADTFVSAAEITDLWEVAPIRGV